MDYDLMPVEVLKKKLSDISLEIEGANHDYTLMPSEQSDLLVDLRSIYFSIMEELNHREEDQKLAAKEDEILQWY